MKIKRSSEKRIMVKADVDRDFLGQCVLLDAREFPTESKGYLVAYGQESDEVFKMLFEMSFNELNGKGLIVTGSKKRGEDTLGLYS